MAAPRVVTSIAAVGAAIRTRIDLRRDEATRKVRDVKVPDLWAALAELTVLRSLHEDEGARSLDLTLDQAVINRALRTPAARKLLADTRLRDVDVAFTPAGIVIGVVAQVGPVRLPRRRYTLPVGARRGALEVDLREVLRIPVVGAKIAAILDTQRDGLGGLKVRRREDVLTIAHPRLRCERAACEEGTLAVTLTATGRGRDA
jgi:hypothetical protein